MKILPFEIKYIDQAVEMFIKNFTEDQFYISKEAAREYIELNLGKIPNYSFMCLTDENLVGVLFARKATFITGESLFLDTIMVEPNSRKQGIAKKLFKTVILEARSNKIDHYHALADGRVTFPLKWYERMGFEKTGWVELAGSLNDLKF
ncbi:MAG: GNAT family N-acetyltransferase [Paludibacteraceae bacterium]|nr:GNAT family N-acetyltransferase [Paludibacteraceae bacterium]